MACPQSSKIRFRVDPGDVPPEKAARRLHLTLEEFNARLPKLHERGFPKADPDTGMFDLDAVDRWRHARHDPAPQLTPSTSPIQHVDEDMAERFVAAKERQAQRGRRHRGAS